VSGCGGCCAGAAVVVATANGAGGAEIGRAENRHHTAASTTAATAPVTMGMSADRRLAGTVLIVGVIFCPVSGDESDFAGTPVTEAIA
jgi:hypothetical protein